MIDRPRLTSRVFLLALSILLTVASDSAFATTTRIFNVSVATPIAEFLITFSSVSGSHTVELRNVGPQADPVVHALNSAGTQIGSATPSNGQLILTLPGNLSGIFRIVV